MFKIEVKPRAITGRDAIKLTEKQRAQFDQVMRDRYLRPRDKKITLEENQRLRKLTP